MENYRERKRSKYLDMVLNGAWKVVKIHSINKYKTPIYTIENIYNNKQIDICDCTIRNIINGKTSVSRVICRRIRGAKYGRTRNSGD